MRFHNLKLDSQTVDFASAVRQGLGDKQGLFFPKQFSPISQVETLLELPKLARNFQILKPFVQNNLSDAQLEDVIKATFSFPTELRPVSSNISCLELFHGPTLAFKDFGATFMAQCLGHFSNDKKITILTATSGDTGAAVARAFYGLENIEVVILYPKGKISKLQEKMFTTLGGNIRTIAVAGAFDDCQQLVKQSFDDKSLVERVGLNSANSINISRLLAQVCYYFDAVSNLPTQQRNQIVVSVPSGNFGNLTAGIIAKLLGLPVKRFIACTNSNDTVPRYLETGKWLPKSTISTLSNAMDVSQPNNWPRIEYLIDSGQFNAAQLSGCKVDEDETKHAMLELRDGGYISEPHAAVAYQGLKKSLKPDEQGIFLGTAHPAKFKQSVDEILALDLPLPQALAECSQKNSLSIDMPNDFEQLKEFLLS
jgi:threonine synthase